MLRREHAGTVLLELTDLECAKCKLAYKYAKAKFGLLTTGTHSVSFPVATRLITAMGLRPNDVVWEIGCGRPALAAAQSAYTGQQVLCTDTPEITKSIMEIVHILMDKRDVLTNRQTFQSVSATTPTEALQAYINNCKVKRALFTEALGLGIDLS